MATVATICTALFIFASRFTFGVSVASVFFFGSPFHQALREYLPLTKRSLIPLLHTTYSVDDIKKAHAQSPINFIWITLSSSQLKTINLEEIASAAPGAIIVNLTPSIMDYPYLVEKYPGLVGRIIQGTIPFISYQYPLKVCQVFYFFSPHFN